MKFFFQTAYLGFLATMLATGCDPIDRACNRIKQDEAALVAQFEAVVVGTQLTDDEIEALILEEFPVELAVVLDDPQAYEIDESHPLFGALPVDGGDSFEFLNGCWGRYDPAVETTSEEGLAVATRAVAQAMRIDLRTEGFFDLRSYIIDGVDGFTCKTDQRPAVLALRLRLDTVEERFVEGTIFTASAAGVDAQPTGDESTETAGDDDTTGQDDAGDEQNPTGIDAFPVDEYLLSLHEVWALQALQLVEGRSGFMYAVFGDFLVTSRPTFDSESPSIDDIDYWIRFDCLR